MNNKVIMLECLDRMVQLVPHLLITLRGSPGLLQGTLDIHCPLQSGERVFDFDRETNPPD